MEKINNKEIINLLDSLSESESDVSDLVLTPRKKKVKRRLRPGVRVKQNKSCSCNRSQSRTVSLWLAALLITLWLIALSWLAAVLYSEIGRIDVSIRTGNITKNLKIVYYATSEESGSFHRVCLHLRNLHEVKRRFLPSGIRFFSSYAKKLPYFYARNRDGKWPIEVI